MRLQSVLAAVLTAAAAATLLGTGTASAESQPGSFPGCPMLSENHSAGPCVVQLQDDLNVVNRVVNPGYHLQPDGKFGRDTRIAVLDFQGRNHLGADGLVGPITAGLLRQQAQEEGSVATPRPSNQPQDAGGAEPMGKGAVECFIEEVKGKIPTDIIEELIAGKLGKEELLAKLSKYMPVVDALNAAKCVTFG
jgi:Putative peptidoglycan binding domain